MRPDRETLRLARARRHWLAPAVGLYLAIATGCGGSDVPSPDEEMLDVTQADLVGPLCLKRSCECKETPDAAGVPMGTEKRYEFRVGPSPGEMWVTVGEDTLYKSREKPTECFYLDLPPGKHPVTVRSRGEGGLTAAVKISELGAEGPWWYDTFYFNCGSPGRCTLDRLDHWRDRFMSRARRNIIDHCGSTAIRDIAWRTGRVRDRLYPTSIVLQFALDIYSFVPRYPPGHRECAQ
jgi:hypothetical protein